EHAQERDLTRDLLRHVRGRHCQPQSSIPVSAGIRGRPHPNGVRDSSGRRWLTRRVDLDLVFLGTSGSMPTGQRAPAALLLRPGRFDVQAADALGVPPGPERGALQRGEPISLADGTTITPERVLGPARPGRKVVIAGDGGPSETVIEAARNADVLVHEATFCE